MIILVDYDNVDFAVRRKGSFYLISHILDTIGTDLLNEGDRIRVRLYGGWYEAQSLSRSAQRLSVDLQQQFPTAITISRPGAQVKQRVSVELAASLMIDPTATLVNTYRRRGFPENLQFSAPPLRHCVAPHTCALSVMHNTLSIGGCTVSSCPVQLKDVAFREEQKLVDTMLIADLVHVASREKEYIVIVSNDDDMWPGILSALKLGAKVIHVHPRVGRATPYFYCGSVGANYIQRSFTSL
jgi:hypothetical protein